MSNLDLNTMFISMLGLNCLSKGRVFQINGPEQANVSLTNAKISLITTGIFLLVMSLAHTSREGSHPGHGSV